MLRSKNMQQRLRHILLPLLLVLFAFACNRNSGKPGQVEAEYIRYRVNYLDHMAGDIPTSLLPDMMEAYYTKKHVFTRIHGYFGQFSLVQVADLRKNTVTTMLNFFGTKVVHTGKKGEVPAGITQLKNPSLEVTSDTLTVCGMLSTRGIVCDADGEYDVYFIEDIGIKSPNITTPYYFIDHVLSDFRVQLSMLKMHLVMFGHEVRKVDPGMFEIPEAYVPVSRETMEHIINSLFTKE
ncbi:MAG: hypothetical protein P1P82_06930 [Bacteroidales bacterium]|nr:hypothetical protein [Bacteroidales bacterium]MDT8430496.1 hypothetical protein [Bacteroidales bacterium]